MTEKELRRLSRTKLLEMLLDQCREAARLRERVRELEGQIASRELLLQEAGNIAEAAVLVNGVFEAAQAAADQYLENLRRMHQCENILPVTTRK